MVSTLPGEPSVSLTENFIDLISFKIIRRAFLMFKTRKIHHQIQQGTGAAGK